MIRLALGLLLLVIAYYLLPTGAQEAVADLGRDVVTYVKGDEVKR